MSYATNGPVPWPLPPDWTDGVRERLEWLTDVISARNGRAQRRRLRRAPRRTFRFNVLSHGQARRVVDAILNDHGAGYWMLQIWHDVQQLTTALSASTTFIPCRTEGFDFVAGGSALLWRAVNRWALVGIDAIEPGGLVLGTTVGQMWPAGTRLYPVRRARLDVQPEETTWTDASGRRRVTMLIDEPCDWPEELPGATYRGRPVLELRPDAAEDLGNVFERRLEAVDAGTGLLTVYDPPGRSFRSTELRWLAHGRAGNAALRSLLYALAGRMQSVWVPTWNADLVLAAGVAAQAESITVEWAGYTVFGRMQSNWRDIRIELHNGTVFYRRLMSAAESGTTEVLGIDTALGVAVTPGQVRLISFMVLSTQASDAIELLHETDADGLTICRTRFQGERDDL